MFLKAYTSKRSAILSHVAENGGDELKVVSPSCGNGQVSAVMGLANSETVVEVILSCHFSALVKSLWSTKGNQEKKKNLSSFCLQFKKKIRQSNQDFFKKYLDGV